MTAGGWMYIGPQGIVHGTYNTLLNAGRAKLGIPPDGDLTGTAVRISGLGGMSGAQPKAADIAGAVGIIAEVDASRIQTRLDQGWVDRVADSPADAFAAAGECQRRRRALRHRLPRQRGRSARARGGSERPRSTCSRDQTSCHAAYDGGYCPQGLTSKSAPSCCAPTPAGSGSSWTRRSGATTTSIRALAERGTYFFDYGNSFLKAVYDAGVTEVCQQRRGPARTGSSFRPTSRTSWARSCSTTATGPFAGSA